MYHLSLCSLDLFFYKNFPIYFRIKGGYSPIITILRHLIRSLDPMYTESLLMEWRLGINNLD